MASLPAGLDTLRRRVVGHALDVGLRTAATVGRWHPASRPYIEPVETVSDIAYRPTGNPAHRLDVTRPRAGAGDRRPAVLYLHGGGFRILSKETHWMMAGAFAAHGFVVFNANYRLSGEAPFPAAVEDAASAYLWVLEHAAEWGGDPSRIVLAGDSAGANLVTALTVACCFERSEACVHGVFERGVVPRAVVPMCGLLEVSRWQRYDAVPMPRFVRDRLDAVCTGYLGPRAGDEGPHLALANPLTVLESDLAPERPLPPFASSVGTRDPVLDDTRRLERALARRGIRHHVTYHAGEPHAFQALVFRREARRCWHELFEFLDPIV